MPRNSSQEENAGSFKYLGALIDFENAADRQNRPGAWTEGMEEKHAGLCCVNVVTPKTMFPRFPFPAVLSCT